ncbi:MAG: carbamoyltransferase [Elusimicrobia bacterium]|nr:carbamoyltransferase [Elusimicrobiota bacterium]
MIILGINAYHGDSSACLLVDGRLVCAIEEERIVRKKHWAGMPIKSIKWCLKSANIDARQIDYIAIGRNLYAHLDKKILRILTKKPSFAFIKSRFKNADKIKKVKELIATELGVNVNSLKAKVKNIEHHKAHLASSFFVSPFEKAVCVSVDGFGDLVSTMRGFGSDNKITVSDSVHYPHSLGVFYTALTQFLGFPDYGDEYKIMGLSAMGKPRYMKEMCEIVKLVKKGFFKLDMNYFLHHSEGIEMTWNDGVPSIARIYSDKLIDLLGKPRRPKQEITQHHKDIAASVQAMYEEAFFHLLNYSYEMYKNENLCLSGGSIQNSLANGKIRSKTKFKHIYIPPAAYDAGTAVGAAFWVWNHTLGQKREYIMDKPYMGPEYSNDGIEFLLKAQGLEYEKLSNNELYKKIAGFIADKKIVGWFQDRTEWGQRALGNRSILADPRAPEIKDILNERIKKREYFRPFAPSFLEEDIKEWFEESSLTPFMEKVYKIREDKRSLIPAVTHVDGTGRLQSVSKKMSPKYYGLIKAFKEITGVPALLNTSFNENEPIVNKPEEAIACFKRTKMDVLVLNNYVVHANTKSENLGVLESGESPLKVPNGTVA